jgi:nucleoside-diphosphate-sugar epimerase
VVLWGSGSSLDIDGSGRAVVDPSSVVGWLDSLTAFDVGHVTLLSSALVFGPSPDLAVPLSEAAAVPEWPVGHPARRWADIEAAVVDHAAEQGWPLAVLRPVVITGIGASRHPLGDASPWNPRIIDVAESDPYRQFIHVDDVVDAVAWVGERRLAGLFHLAPDGWIRASRQTELSGKLLPRDAAAGGDDIETVRSDPTFRAYLETSLVVSSDALTAAGWNPRRGNEEAVIESAAEGWWSSLTARRRQEVSLAALVGAAATAVGVGVGIARRWGRGAGR